MKSSILFLWIILFSSVIFAQRTAEFETTIYFEDGVGNRDSIVIGYDKDANFEYNPEFGEIKINEPYDTVFEVRAQHVLNDSREIPFSKKIISSVELISGYPCEFIIEGVLFYVFIKHQPLKISWNKWDFNRIACHKHAFLTPDYIAQAVYPDILLDPESGNRYACLSTEDEIEWEMGYKYIPMNEEPYMEIVEVGTGLDTIFGIYLNYWLYPNHRPDLYSLCSPIVGVEDQIIKQENQSIVLYPNPTSNSFQIEITPDLYEKHDFKIYNTNGVLLFEEKGLQNRMNVLLPDKIGNGLYFYEISSIESGRIASGKLVIQK